MLSCKEGCGKKIYVRRKDVDLCLLTVVVSKVELGQHLSESNSDF